MNDDGSVSRATVLEVLKAHGIDLSDHQGNPFVFTTTAKGDDPEGTLQVHALSDPVHRRMLHFLSRKLGVPIHHFYNVDMVAAPKKTATATAAPSKKKR